MKELLIPVAMFVTVFYNVTYIIHCMKNRRTNSWCGMIIITAVAVLLAFVVMK